MIFKHARLPLCNCKAQPVMFDAVAAMASLMHFQLQCVAVEPRHRQLMKWSGGIFSVEVSDVAGGA